ncbi:alpha/beta hydrolase [Breznakiella homolactica]|uniref:Acetylesterase n=1 Tax=Breznakiella homolactica TaxID=2798577 RepID=A0A7T8BB74_9SPIR|nr:alpha/beta hydrolase-fold protein [Breznakiella homolactica]QQO10116.1 acetylesterase [Breznakiella homolactica]
MIFRGTIYSEVLAMDTAVTVVLPDAFGSTTPAGTVYLLHGLHGSSGSWPDNTMLPVFVREYNAVFIMPEAGRSFYTDMKYGPKFFSYVSEELPEICARVFRISPEPENTAVMGASMGGYGALKFALSKPGRYGYCAAFSSASLDLKETLAAMKDDPVKAAARIHQGEELVRDFYSILGPDLEWNAADDITELALAAASAPAKPKIFCACGTEDYLYKSNVRFWEKMKNLPFDFTCEEWSGRHDWYFFNDALKKALDWCFGFRES